MGIRKNNQSFNRIFIGRAPGPFLLTLILALLISGAVGYVGMSGILSAIYGSSSEAAAGTEEATMSEGDGSEEDSENNQNKVSVDAQSVSLFTVQVSSLSDESAAKDAVALFAEAGLQVGYYHSGNYYKVVAGLTPDEQSAKLYAKRIVEKYPKYKDAFTSTYTYEMSAFDVMVEGIESGTLSKNIKLLIESYGELITTAQIEDEISTDSVEAIHERGTFLESIDTESLQDDNIIKVMKTFNENIQKLVDRKANVSAYNQLWLKFILNETN